MLAVIFWKDAWHVYNVANYSFNSAYTFRERHLFENFLASHQIIFRQDLAYNQTIWLLEEKAN